MKGLLVKELLNMRMYVKTMAILIVFFLVFGIMQKSTAALMSMLTFVPVLLILITAVNSIAMDDASKWNCYAVSMPLRRRDVVKSKYLYLILMTICLNLIALLIGLCFNLVFPTAEFWYSALGLTGGICVTLFMLSISMPLLYKFGAEKSRLLIMAVIMVPSLLIGILPSVIKLPDLSAIPWEDYTWALGLLPVAFLLLYLFSYTLSVRIFSKKDL